MSDEIRRLRDERDKAVGDANALATWLCELLEGSGCTTDEIADGERHYGVRLREIAVGHDETQARSRQLS